MPVKYNIPNVSEIGVACDYCNGTGYQAIQGVGYRACQYCITGYKVKNCPECRGRGCRACMGTKHEFYSEIAPVGRVSLPDTPTRSFAGEPSPRPATQHTRSVPRR